MLPRSGHEACSCRAQRLRWAGTADRLAGVEHLLEYQDYLLAYRLRALIGGRLRPGAPPLSLPGYAARRLRRQALARGLAVGSAGRGALREVERLTDELSFGLWHDPVETVALLRHVVAAGGCVALESEAAFASELLTRGERHRAGQEAVALLASYYLGLVRASAACLDAEAFDRLRGALDPARARLPLVVDAAPVAADDA